MASINDELTILLNLIERCRPVSPGSPAILEDARAAVARSAELTESVLLSLGKLDRKRDPIRASLSYLLHVLDE